MTQKARKAMLQQPTIGYTDALGGIAVKRIEYGINDYVTYVVGTMCTKPSVHSRKIMHSVKKGAYFVHNGHAVYLADCMRV